LPGQGFDLRGVGHIHRHRQYVAVVLRPQSVRRSRCVGELTRRNDEVTPGFGHHVGHVEAQMARATRDEATCPARLNMSEMLMGNEPRVTHAR